MPVPLLSVRLRLGALVLLASVLPLVVQAPAPTGGGTGIGTRPAAWLRAQVNVAPGGAPAQKKKKARAAFDQALAKATAADTRTLHDFLAAFLDAHAGLTDAEAPATEGRSARTLVAELRRQLAEVGLVVRPPTQMSAPPTGPYERARWAGAASLLVPNCSSNGAGSARSQAPSAFASVVERVAAPVARGALLRVLFAGRRLGP